MNLAIDIKTISNWLAWREIGMLQKIIIDVGLAIKAYLTHGYAKRMWHGRIIAIGVILLISAVAASAQAPIEYHLSFADAVHHVMRVEVTLRNVPRGRLQILMSRSSPGRYAAFDFAKNVFNEQIRDSEGKALSVTRPNPREWDIANHRGTVQISYNVFGDRVDGTFLAVDTTHAHINFPAALMWARGFEDRATRIKFLLPPGSGWKIATQLYQTDDPLIFSAPNLQYLMDSPVELSNFAMRTFTMPALTADGKGETLRVAMHHLGTDAELDLFVADFKKIVRQEQAVFGELPDFEPGYYTLLADYLPWNAGGGMEHRNSSVVTSFRSLEKSRLGMLSTAAHEFFHCWNVKRIRPASLEPFDFNDANTSDELWLAEGFTNYYERLILIRSGLADVPNSIEQMGNEISYVVAAPGGELRSPVEMSQLAPFVDLGGGTPPDPTYWENTFISYYSIGDAIAAGLDLTLRARSNSRVTLDDFMRAMWRVHGKPGGSAPGLVLRPYTLTDIRERLAEVTGDRVFADDFVDRYIAGKEHIDYTPLLLRAGFVLRQKEKGHATLGPVALDKKGGATQRVVRPTVIGSPAYQAGLDLDDELISVAGVLLSSPDDLFKAIAGRQPGEEVELVFRRRGQEVHAKARLAEDQRLELVPIEKTGGALTGEQRRFRAAWLNTRASGG